MELVPRAIYQPDSDQNRPVFACLRCWRLKKRCDRVSPKCGRCYSGGVKCIYSIQPPTKSLLHSRTSKHAAVLKPYGGDIVMEASTVIIDTPSLIKNQDICHFQLFANHLLPQCHEHHPDFNIIYTTFNKFRQQVEAACNLYLKTMNVWLPILIDAQLQEQLELLRGNADPQVDVCMLMLCIYLATIVPESATKGIADAEDIYAVLKFFHINYHLIGSPSVSVIQAGLLLAIYEQGNGLEQDAYQSLGYCSRMGYLMELDKTLHHFGPHLKAEQTVFDTYKHVWWCNIILERILALQSPVLAQNFTCPDPRHDDYLPAFHTAKEEWSRTATPVGTIAAPQSAFPKHSIVFSMTNPFGKSAQAIYLLDCVFELIIKPSHGSNAWYLEAESLDMTLQSFVLSTLHQSNLERDEKWHYSCGPYSICISALFVLHKHCIPGSSTSYHHLSSKSCNFQQKSSLALKSLARNLMANSEHQVNGLFSDYNNIPPYGLHYLRDAALFSLEMERSGEDVKGWQNNFRVLNDFLVVSSRKWKVAKIYISDISEGINL